MRGRCDVVTARTLLGLFDSVYVLALAAWVGSIFFLSFGVAPLIFKALDSASAAKLVRGLFPRYYAWGAIAGAVALPSFVAGALCFPEFRGPLVGVQAMAILLCVLASLYAGNSLTPAIHEARDAGPSGEARFNRLHRRAVRINAAVLVVVCALLVRFATRPSPRTAGIIEQFPGSQGPGAVGFGLSPGVRRAGPAPAENRRREARPDRFGVD
jgi:hypothetical protein